MRTDIEQIREAALAVIRGVVLPRISRRLLAELCGVNKSDCRLLGRIVGQHERMLEKSFSSITKPQELDSLRHIYAEDELEHSIRSKYLVEHIRNLKPMVDKVTLQLSRLEGDLSCLDRSKDEFTDLPEVISDTLERYGVRPDEYNHQRQNQFQEGVS